VKAPKRGGIFSKALFCDASKQSRQDTRFGNTFHARFKFFQIRFPNFKSLLMHEMFCAKLISLSLSFSLFYT